MQQSQRQLSHRRQQQQQQHILLIPQPMNVNLMMGCRQRTVAWQAPTIMFVLWWLAHTFQVMDMAYPSSHGRDESIALTAMLHRNSQREASSSTESFQPLHNQGICQRRDGSGTPGKSSATTRRRPIFLWGIPSTVTEKEVQRRNAIRSTYLSYFIQLEAYLANNGTIYSSNPKRPFPPFLSKKKSIQLPVTNRICSLQEWTCRYDELYDKCQIIYVFFIGGNPGAPTELLDESLTDFRQMLAPPFSNYNGSDYNIHYTNNNNNDTSPLSSSSSSPSSSSPRVVTKTKHDNKIVSNISEVSIDDYHRMVQNNHEPGVVYLNIRENQFDGKMTTWFQFAALVGEEYPEIDYAAKVDSDLLLFPPKFLNLMEEEHRQVQSARRAKDDAPTRRVYGGVEFADTSCIMNETGHDHPCPLPLVGPSYMSGELNFVSMDLARYIVSDSCPRKELTIHHEDVSLSNYVYSYTGNTAYHKQERQRNLGGRNQASVVDTNIAIISLNKRFVLRTKDLAANGQRVNFRVNPEKLEHYIFGHSSNPAPHPHLLWKQVEEFQNMWALYFYYHALGLNGPSAITFMDTLNKMSRKVRYPGDFPGLALDRQATEYRRSTMQRVRVNKGKLGTKLP